MSDIDCKEISSRSTEDRLHPLRCLCPLFGMDVKGWPHPIGTGTLIAIGDDRFLVTSAHVMDLVPEREYFEVFTALRGELGPLKGEGAITKIPPSGSRDDDRADIAFFRLDDEVADAIEAQFNFWPINRIAVGMEETVATHYTFSGYPNRDSKARGPGRVRSDPRHVTAGSYCDVDYRRVGVSASTHIGIRLEGGPLMNGMGYELRRIHLGDMMNGLSGGAVWRNYLAFDRKTTEWPQMVGISMELPLQYSKSFLGVRITVVLEGIRARFPHLSPYIPFTPGLGVVSSRAAISREA